MESGRERKDTDTRREGEIKLSESQDVGTFTLSKTNSSPHLPTKLPQVLHVPKVAVVDALLLPRDLRVVQGLPHTLRHLLFLELDPSLRIALSPPAAEALPTRPSGLVLFS